MNKLLFTSVFVVSFIINTLAQPSIAVIPEPVQMEQLPGLFILPKSIAIEAPNLPELKPTIEFLHQRLSLATGYEVKISSQSPKAVVKLILNKSENKIIGSEGYQLTITSKNIIIQANHAAGLFYGVQTLMQLFPNEIESSVAVHHVKWQAPCVTITDYPRFGWRGLMLDVSRHFFTKQEVKEFIDQMARYKLNLFHWHLTDDNGWRLEIKAFPKLTEKGAWRIEGTGLYGGFYTQEDIKEVVQYARDRYVNILPEVDIPGHSYAAVVSYPEISCTPDARQYKLRGDTRIMDWKPDYTFEAFVDNTFCPANEKAYTFLDTVFTEMAALFPFEYIHVGGDECAKNFWKKSDAVKALMVKEGLMTMQEVQSYFEKRVGQIIASKGKKLIGWDEILEGGLADNAAVMSWRGFKGGIEASKLKHDVVMSPTIYTYLDYMQGDTYAETNNTTLLRLNKVYQFDPLVAGADERYIKGGQANVWTEMITNMRQVEYMTWPRAFAIAESVWSPKEKKDWNSFVARVEQQFKRYDIREVKYARSIYDPIFTAKNNNGHLQIELATEIEGLDIYYSFDNSFPDRFYPKYTAAIIPPEYAEKLIVITYRNNQPIGKMISMPVDELQKRAGLNK
ncbi:MAG: family 20 glycosylhydrolase [Prolixibacteraceae bacterium]|nr:family 20 glycosylhydrolase [Prolixibacteraceae bacterium]